MSTDEEKKEELNEVFREEYIKILKKKYKIKLFVMLGLSIMLLIMWLKVCLGFIALGLELSLLFAVGEELCITLIIIGFWKIHTNYEIQLSEISTFCIVDSFEEYKQKALLDYFKKGKGIYY